MGSCFWRFKCKTGKPHRSGPLVRAAHCDENIHQSKWSYLQSGSKDTLRETGPPQYLLRGHPQQPKDVPLNVSSLKYPRHLPQCHLGNQVLTWLHMTFMGHSSKPQQHTTPKCPCMESQLLPFHSLHSLKGSSQAAAWGPGYSAHTCGSVPGTVSVTLSSPAAPPSPTTRKVWVRPCTAGNPLAVAPSRLLCSLSTAHG